jgi:osmotically-inducible protein OsmY
MDDQDITVDVLANNVTLYGTVNSYYQKNEAERIAWNAPGVWTVKNELVIDFKD